MPSSKALRRTSQVLCEACQPQLHERLSSGSWQDDYTDRLWAVAAAPATAPWNVAGGWGTAISPPWPARPPPAPAAPARVTHVAPVGKAAAPSSLQQVQSGTSSLSARSPTLNLFALETNMVFVHTPPAPEVLEPLVTHVAPPAQAHEVEDEDVTAHFEATELRPTWDDIY